MKLAIFDLDGTLINSMHVWVQIDEEYLRSFGFEPDEEYKRTIITLTFEEASAYIVKRYGVQKTTSEASAELEALAHEYYRSKIEMKTGAVEYLRALKAQCVKLAIATSCLRPLCEAVLKRYGVFELFDLFLYSSELQTTKKEAEIFLTACRYFDIPPQDTALFEDMAFACEVAKKVGITTYGVTDDFSSFQHQQLFDACDYLIKDFSELLN